MITIPTYLALGVPTELVLGTNKAVSTTGTSVAVFRYIRGGLIAWRLMIFAIVSGMLGSFVGAKLSIYLTRPIMLGILLAVIPLIFLLQRKIDLKGQGESQLEIGLGSIIKATIIGLLIGGYDGLFGPGTGTFLIIAFVMILNMNYKEASSNGRIINYISNLAALTVFLWQGRIYWPAAFVAFGGAMIGNYLGSGLVLSKAEKIVGPVFRLVLFGLLIKCIYDISIEYF